MADLSKEMEQAKAAPKKMESAINIGNKAKVLEMMNTLQKQINDGMWEDNEDVAKAETKKLQKQFISTRESS